MRSPVLLHTFKNKKPRLWASLRFGPDLRIGNLGLKLIWRGFK